MATRPAKTPTTPAKRTRGERSLADLLARYPPQVQTLARQTRRFILEVVPKAEETVDGSGPYVGYGYGPGYKGLVAALIVSKTGVKIGLSQGASLPDPRGLLAGAGKVHRHIAISAAADLTRPGVRPLLKAALANWKTRQTALRARP
jgi:hypothetical protein